MKRCVLPEVLLLVLAARFAFSGSHSHYFFTTLTYNLPSDFPIYYTTRTIDDVTLFWFDSDNGVVERRVPWFKGANISLVALSLNEYRFLRIINNTLFSIMDFLNDTEEYYILQNLDGCTLFDNGTVNVIKSYHYNGEPLMVFDWEEKQWIAEKPEYEDLVDALFGNVTMSEQEKNISLTACIPHIEELLVLGKCTFDRKEAPVVAVTQTPIDKDGVRAYCRAYGHYPKDIFIMWYKNGQQISEEMMERVTLPLPDLTYLTSLSANISSVTDDVYTCKVNHSSLLNFTQDLRTDMQQGGDYENQSEPPSNPSIGAVIAICLAIILVVVIITFAAVSCEISRRQ